VKRLAGFLLACALAAGAPLVSARRSAEVGDFPGWPTAFDGLPLREEPLAPREARFAADFPGRIATFNDGRRHLLLRWIVRPSRQLHPAADCLRGAGYDVEPRPLVVDAEQRMWSTSVARLDGRSWSVRERIVGRRGDAYPDVSSWYWSALLGRSEGPWLAWTVFESE